jgi:diguanylate cyclase (GGDEF)-like protein/PAS domain S-box-containing protein
VDTAISSGGNRSVNRLTDRASWLYLAINVALLPVYFLVTRGAAQKVLFYVYGLSSVAAILWAVRTHAPQRRRAWMALTVGLLLFVMGDMAFDFYARSGHTPVPSFADALYLAAYPMLALGTALFVRSRGRNGDVAAMIDGAIVAIGAGVAAWVFLMKPYADDRTLGLAGRVVPIAYPALDLLLIAAVARLVLGRGSREPAFRLLAGGLVALLAADAFFAFATLHQTYADGSVIDLGWIVCYALVGAAALHPSMSQLTEPAEVELARGRFAMLTLAAAALAAPLMLMVQDGRGDTSSVFVLAAMAAATFLLVLGRVGILTRALDAAYRRVARAGDRQRVLTETALSLVGAGDPTSVARAAVRAAADLAGDRSGWSAYAAVDGDSPSVVAAMGVSRTSPRARLAQTLVSTWSASEPPTGPVALPTDDVRVQRRGPAAEPAVSVPVVVDGSLRGALLVGGIANGGSDVLPALALLSSQLSLALQTAEASEDRLRARSEHQFRSLVQHSTDVVTLIGPDGLIRYVSPAVNTVLGMEPGTLVGTSLLSVVHRDDAHAVVNRFQLVLAGPNGASARLDARVRHVDGDWRDVESVITNLVDDRDVGAIVLNSRDVTARRRLERELNRQAFHDVLTGLANRALFVDRADHALDRRSDEHPEVAIVFLDLDDFKLVNDTLGHPIGDELLIAVADRIRAATRPGDTVARFGGDEFAVLLEAGGMAAAEALADRLAEALDAPVETAGQALAVSASIGIAIGRPGVQRADDLLRDADLAMYMAKRKGKGRFEWFDPTMYEAAVRRMAVTAELRHGIEAGDLEVFYQPIMSIQNSTVVGVEALVRWHHPTRGLVAPDEFIPVAEASGLIVPLGNAVLAEACRQVAVWRRAGIVDLGFYVGVNLSARQLRESTIVEDTARVLHETGLPASALVLEVTETTIMEDFEIAAKRLEGLKGLGLRLALDDFGTGYSSLSYLRDLPMDAVKIDKSFIDRVAQDPEGAAMVRSVVELTRTLGMTSIAEGVEQGNQLSVLDELGCDSVQGYLFAKPVSGTSAPSVLQQLRGDRTAQGQPTSASPTSASPTSAARTVDAASPAGWYGRSP